MTRNKISEIVNFAPGRIVYEEWHINEQQKLATQTDYLEEDLLQVTFSGDIILDVGWYPANSDAGQFHVDVIRDANWDEPVFHAEVKNLDVLYSVLGAARQTALDAAGPVAR